MAESNDAAAAAPTETQPASKGGKLIVILAVVNFVAVLGLGGYILYTRQLAAAQPAAKAAAKSAAHGAEQAEGHGEPQEGEHAEPEGEHAAKADSKKKDLDDDVASPHGDERAGKGPLLPLEAMVTNLSDPDSDRYLKVAMQLRITSEAAKPEVEAYLVPVRNQILLYLSSLTIADTSGADNKREIQRRVKRIANESMPSSRITQVYFTEFVIQ